MSLAAFGGACYTAFKKGESPLDGMKIGQFSALTGCPEQTIRYYEEMGLLSPARMPGSNYRLYTQRELMALMQMRQFHGLSIPLKELSGANDSMDGMDKLLDRYRQAVERQLDDLEMQLERIKTIQQRMAQATNQVRRANIGPIYRLMLSDAAVLAHSDTPAIVRQWLSIMPFSHFTVIIPRRQLADRGVERFDGIQWGIGVIERYVERLEEAPRAPAVLYPKTRCICANLLVDDPLGIRPGELSPFYAYLEEHGLFFSGDMYGLVIYVSPGRREKSLVCLHAEVTMQ